MSETTTDTKTEDDLTLDAAPVCEVECITATGYTWAPPCGNPASWWGVNLCCGQRGLFCDSCKRRADGHGDFRYTLDICGECGGRGIRWVKL